MGLWWIGRAITCISGRWVGVLGRRWWGRGTIIIVAPLLVIIPATRAIVMTAIPIVIVVLGTIILVVCIALGSSIVCSRGWLVMDGQKLFDICPYSGKIKPLGRVF